MMSTQIELNQAGVHLDHINNKHNLIIITVKKQI